MVKSPIEYFASQDFDAKVSPEDSMTPAELAFVRKYMGMDPVQALASVPVAEGDSPASPPAPAPASPPASMPAGVPRATSPASAPQGAPAVRAPVEALPVETMSVETTLRTAESVQFVGFYVGSQLYAMPTLAIQEVIRRQAVSQLPMAPSFVSGVINLRGHITPLIRMRTLLDMPEAGDDDERFTIICRCGGLQFGVQIDQLQTMYRVLQKDLNWNAEASVGANVEFITGLFEVDNKLVPIISIDRLVDKVLNA